jgi:hypothetical protein
LRLSGASAPQKDVAAPSAPTFLRRYFQILR